jgi:hypothetical protein
MGLGPGGERYLLDWWRGQVGPEIWIERKIDMMLKWKLLAWFEEKGPIARATEARLRQRMREREVAPAGSSTCRPSATRSPTRRRSSRTPAWACCSGRAAAWVPELQRQCLVFPAGSPDDGVDCLGQLGRGAATIGRAALPPAGTPALPMVSPWANRRG